MAILSRIGHPGSAFAWCQTAAMGGVALSGISSFGVVGSRMSCGGGASPDRVVGSECFLGWLRQGGCANDSETVSLVKALQAHVQKMSAFLPGSESRDARLHCKVQFLSEMNGLGGFKASEIYQDGNPAASTMG
jgi:hypothetical protein